mgnify:CR=1 FL=1
MFREILICICVDIIHGFRVELVTKVYPEKIINDIILVAYCLLQKIKQDNSKSKKPDDLAHKFHAFERNVIIIIPLSHQPGTNQQEKSKFW